MIEAGAELMSRFASRRPCRRPGPQAQLAATWALVVGCLVGLASPVASAKDDFLPPQQAYQYSVRAAGDQIVVTWKIEPGYYLYKKKMGIASPLSSVQLADPQWPKGEDHEDEYFGRQREYVEAVGAWCADACPLIAR